MSKMMQRAVALVVMLVVVMGGTIWGVSSTTIHYRPLDNGAPVVMTVNGDEVCADEYAGYMLYNMSYYANMYAQLGMSDVWNDEYAAATLGSSMPAAAKDQSVYARVVLQKFNELGLKLTYDQEKQMTQLRQDTIDSMSYDAYAKQIANFGFSDQSYSNFMYISQCYNALNEYYYGENGANVPSDDELRQYFADNYLAAKHILISTVDSMTGETIRTDAEAKAEAQKILDRINAGEDYDTLMNEYSEDTGLESNPDGYTTTVGQMVPAFEETALSLEFGEISDVVESSYGYHIILRGEVEDLDSYADQYRQSLLDARIDQWLEDAEVTPVETIENLDVANFYNRYNAWQTAMAEQLQADSDSDASASPAQSGSAEE